MPVWIPIAMVIPLFFVWSVVHEGSHAVAGIISGRKVKEFKPWPHMQSGHFVFCGLRLDRRGNTFSDVAPYLVDALAMVGLTVGGVFADGLCGVVLVTAMGAPSVNTIVGVQARLRGNERADLSRVHWGWALPFYYLAMGYVVAISVTLLRMSWS